jgi:MinD superfamily P-loop ATPase
MREIVILSGKGGTGKTSLTAAFAHLASGHIICDLDVDAPDLHLILQPENQHIEHFISGHAAVIRPDDCERCGQCPATCRYDAIQGEDPPVIDPLKCEGCKLCVVLCPAQAIDFEPNHCGDWYRSTSRFGPMVHAQLFPAEENSGRLVALLRQQARAIAEAKGLDLILSDGPPGIGCPVISALSGTDLAVIVTEPTVSGRHDLERVLELCRHFKIPTGVIINKCDLNIEQAEGIEAYCKTNHLSLIGKLPHDMAFTEAMIQRLTLTEFSSNGTRAAVESAWNNILKLAHPNRSSNGLPTADPLFKPGYKPLERS